MRSQTNLAAGIAAAVATVLLALCNLPFLPVAQASTSPFSWADFSVPGFSIGATVWGFDVAADGDQQFLTWYEPETEASAGLQAVPPIYVLATLGALATTVLLLVGRARMGAVAGLAAVALLAIAMALLLTGVLSHEAGSTLQVAAGFWLMLVGGLALMGVALAGWLSPNRRDVHEAAAAVLPQ